MKSGRPLTHKDSILVTTLPLHMAYLADLLIDVCCRFTGMYPEQELKLVIVGKDLPDKVWAVGTRMSNGTFTWCLAKKGHSSWHRTMNITSHSLYHSSNSMVDYSSNGTTQIVATTGSEADLTAYHALQHQACAATRSILEICLHCTARRRSLRGHIYLVTQSSQFANVHTRIDYYCLPYWFECI